jgi:hypothetical protein
VVAGNRGIKRLHHAAWRGRGSGTWIRTTVDRSRVCFPGLYRLVGVSAGVKRLCAFKWHDNFVESAVLVSIACDELRLDKWHNYSRCDSVWQVRRR